MHEYDACEIAYKNGYEAGWLAALEETKILIDKIYVEPGHNIARISGHCGDKEFNYGVPFDISEFCHLYCIKFK